MDSESLGNRNFYTLPKRDHSARPPLNSSATPEELIELVRENEIGKDHSFVTAFGKRSIVYCDHTASGRPLEFIENFISQQVLPTYANTHTTSSITGLQSTLYRHEARTIVRNALKASENDAVIFTGSGSTGGIQLLISAMGLSTPPVVFVGPSEHHSAELPWLNANCHVERIRENQLGQPDYDELDFKLKKWSSTGLPLIGCFSAASNVTGILSDTIKLAQIMHKYDGLAIFDYATAAPYVKIDMHPKEPNSSKDAIFFSPHKFPGGVNTPGILVAAKKLFKNKVPHGGGGGGTVFWVSQENHRFLAEAEEREEPGTPDLVGSIRCGMIMQLKESISSDVIFSREEEIAKKALSVLNSIPNLEVLAGEIADRLPIFSFMIRVPDSDLYLHYNYVSALLNDLFGIQVRGGCVCAGPYGMELIGMRTEKDSSLVQRFEKILLEDSRLDRIHLRRARESSEFEILRPGFVRFSLPYFFEDSLVDEVLQSIKWVAEHGWKLLSHYVFDCETGEWKHSLNLSYSDRRWLGDIRFSKSGVEVKEPTDANKINGTDCKTLKEALEAAEKIAQKNRPKAGQSDQSTGFQGEAHELRWFLLPSEARDLLRKNKLFDNLKKSPFIVRKSIPKNNYESYELDSKLVEKLKEVSSWSKSVIKAEPEKKDDPKKEKTKNAEKRKNEKVEEQECTDDVCVPCLLPRKKKAKVENGASNGEKRKKRRPIHPPKVLMRKVGDAIEEFEMIKNGDRVIVGLSGGKDSMTLLHALLQYRHIARHTLKMDFTVGALTVDPQVASYDPCSLIEYMEELGVEYIYKEEPIFANAQKLPDLRSICSYCSRMKRGIMYSAMREGKWNVLALGQHLDDCAESFLMSAFHNSQLFTMKANYTVKAGDLRVIRPLAFVRETETRAFAESNKLPVIPENCPACFSEPKERNRMKQLLAQQEILHPHLFHSLKKTLRPLLGMSIGEHFSKDNRTEEGNGDGTSTVADECNPDDE